MKTASFHFLGVVLLPEIEPLDVNKYPAWSVVMFLRIVKLLGLIACMACTFTGMT